MQTVGTIADTDAGTVYYRPDGTRRPKRSEQEKTDYGAKRRCNSFLKTQFVPVAPVIVTREWNGKEYNYMTKENYTYLLKSALRYASLMGIELTHNSGKALQTSMMNWTTS